MTSGKQGTFSVANWVASEKALNVAYKTTLGSALIGPSEDFLVSSAARKLKKKIQLVLTSPPYPLNRKKAYGNETGAAFKRWLKKYALLLRDQLADDGSIVIEMGNAWEQGSPVMSTLAIESLLAFKKAADLHLCQEFIWYNTARLPGPAQWVTIERIRVKDAFTRLWWLSPSPKPKADNRRVLQPYSKSMQKLLKTQKYNSGKRPSEHHIGDTSFLSNNGGAIPSNVIGYEVPDSLLASSNTESADPYHNYCRARGLTPHPARMPLKLATFFIKLCTEPGDIVFDPFGGSNTTGAAAEQNGRQWVTVEALAEYAQAGIGRFPALVSEQKAVDMEAAQ